MRSDLSEIRSSPFATAVFLLAVAVFVGTILFLPNNSWGAPVGSIDWWVGFGFAALAIALGVRSWRRNDS
ncbi:MAG: hypothetical protein IH933_14035 [Euryarchaeota archaeon]|jgi:hypothetical protein|nr:hypothetical protein [Euryarchaeota archaeon]